MINIPNPKLFGARHILKTRGIEVPIRAHATWDSDTQSFTLWDENVLGPQPTDAELETAYAEFFKDRLREELANKRYEVEVGGVLFNGLPIKTDRSSQMLLNGALNYVGKKPSSTIRWKTGNGVFVSLNAAQIEAAAVAVGDHVQACFAREGEISAAIDTATTEAEIAAIINDINNFSY